KESAYQEGRWETLPFQRAIMNAMGSDYIREVNVVKSARVGYSKMLLGVYAYFIEHKQRNTLIWLPTDGDAENFMKTHVEPTIRDIPSLLALAPWYGKKHRDNTLTMKRFSNGRGFWCLGGKAAKNYREKSVDVAGYDELAAFDEDIEQEGSPTFLGDKRIEGSVWPKSIRGSTPKVRGTCQIERAASESPHFMRFHVACPHCGEEQYLKFGDKETPFGLKWTPDDPSSVFYLCEHNACVIRQQELDFTDARYICEKTGIWTRDGILWFSSSGEEIEPPDSVTFHIWTAYSPFTTWVQIVKDWMKTKGDTRTITSANIDRLRFTFGVQALVETTSKGDRNPSEVRLLVQIQRNGGWVTEKDITIKGKTTSQYLASVVVGNLPPRPFNIRMRRMTPDSTTDQLQNKTLWSSYTEIIDVKQCYPNTALVGVQVDSEQFGSQQVSRNYHLRGRILQVPSNYNPQTRQYSGIWDGTLKPAYSNNMAWCLWDMLTHPRYGMGKRLGAADVDKWALYVIGQYCDQLVPNGFGGTEPRITCNAYLTTQRKAWDVLSDFCSAMRCMPVWNGQTLTFVQDRPSDISGSVNANSGTLNNVTINQNCTIKGMLEATQVRGDFVKAVSKSFPKQAGTWGNTETPNGTVTVTISDDHNFDRQIIIPPIIFNGIAYSDPGSGNNPGGTRYTGYGFEVRKNGVLIASRETKGAIPGSYSAVIDMPSGRGSVTLEFKVFHKGNQWAGNITDCTVIVTKKAASGISIR
ncbi:TPA: phage tail tip protein, partial [Escherichia coli]